MSAGVLRVTHVITGLGQGGAESVLFRLVTWPQQDVVHSVVSLTDDGMYGARLRAAGIVVHSLGMPRGRATLRGVLGLRRLLQALRPDVVQTWMYHADLLGGVAARLAGIRAVAWGIRNSGMHLDRSSRSGRLVLKLCARLSGWVPAAIVCAARDAAARHGEKGYRADRMTVISNGYDFSRFAPDAPARERLRADWGVAPDELLLGCVARWDPLKDHATLLRALALAGAQAQGLAPRCVLVGRGMAADNTALVALIEELGLRERVLLRGPSDDVPAVMNALDLHVLSSCAEGFPNVVAEAIACGTPCLVTDVGDASYIVGDTGWVVPPEQPAALAQAMQVALQSIARHGRADRGQAGRQRALNEFGLDRMVRAYGDLWRRIAEQGL